MIKKISTIKYKTIKCNEKKINFRIEFLDWWKISWLIALKV